MQDLSEVFWANRLLYIIKIKNEKGNKRKICHAIEIL